MKRFDYFSPIQSSLHKRPFVLWIGALVQLKGPLDVIEIARALPGIDFVMIGSPWDVSIFERLMKNKTSNVHYLGPVSDRLKNNLIRLSSAGITTSKYEGFGWIPFEFLTKGKPILAYQLEVFREIYGDLVIYADSIDAFIRNLRELRRKAFKVRFDSEQVALLQRRYSLTRAALRIVRLLDLKSLVIFTRDYPANSNMYLGCDIINWKLWRGASERIPLQIFTNGTRYSRQFHLTSRTTRVGQRLELVEKVRAAMNRGGLKGAESGRQKLAGVNGVLAKILDLIILVTLPVCYTFCYIKKGANARSCYIAASEESTLLAGIIIKFLFGSRLVCIMHDARLYEYDYREASFPMRVYRRIILHCLRHVDSIIVVSRTAQKALSKFCPDTCRFILMYEDVQ